jgi:hypothetical protein
MGVSSPLDTPLKPSLYAHSESSTARAAPFDAQGFSPRSGCLCRSQPHPSTKLTTVRHEGQRPTTYNSRKRPLWAALDEPIQATGFLLYRLDPSPSTRRTRL